MLENLPIFLKKKKKKKTDRRTLKQNLHKSPKPVEKQVNSPASLWAEEKKDILHVFCCSGRA